MGMSYFNTVVKGPAQQEIVLHLESQGISALVSPTENDVTIIYDLVQGADNLSAYFKCPVFLLGVHDDDILGYSLYTDGVEVDTYESCPGYFTGDMLPPKGGDATKLCEAFGAEHAVRRVDEILRSPTVGLAVEQHKDLADALGLPPYAAVVDNLIILEYPEIARNRGLDVSQVAKTGEYGS